MSQGRLFELLCLLLERGRMTAPQLAEHFEVSVRTIYRDIDALSAAGVPVYSTPGKGGGVSLLEGYTLHRAAFTEEEQQLLLTALRSLGVRNAVMLTGDSPRTAAAIAAQLEVDDFRAGVLPADKADYVAALRREGRTVLMVGDGINDSPALSEADAGIAISTGSLWELVRLRQLAMALMRRIQNNYRFVIGFNGALIGLGVAGILPPATSAMLHNLSTLGVSLHSMSALPVEKKEP